MSAKPVRWAPPATLLLLLSPMVGELLSTSAPPAEFFRPLGFVMLVALYGCGALLCRELAHRWGAGWGGLLVLGLAYGIVEEGLAVKSFFDPGWMDLGALATYGRWAGVNWTWSVLLTVYHAVYSVAVPVLIATLALPAWRDRPWLGAGALKAVGWVFALDVALIAGALTSYRPPAAQFLGASVLVVWLAMRARDGVAVPEGPGAEVPPWRYWLLGFAGGWLLFLGLYLVPASGVPWPLGTVAALGAVCWAGWSIGALSGWGRRWGDRHRLAAASGALWTLALIAFGAEGDASRPDDTGGLGAVALLAVVALALLAVAVRRRGAGKAAGSPLEQ